MPRGSTYANNSYNRSLGRVGAPMGSMPVSASSRSSSSGGYSSPASHSCFADNSLNRSVGRVGMPLGSMPVSRSSSTSSESTGYSSSGSPGTYVDNAYNRSVGRVGMPLGSVPVSRSSLSASASPGTGTGTYLADSPRGREAMVYKDNAFNRRLGRVGEPLGSVPHSRGSGASVSQERFYVDNSLNRQLGRVGLKLGTMPVSKTGNTNSRKIAQSTHAMRKMYDQLLQPEVHDIGDLPSNIPCGEQDYMCDTVFSLIRRMTRALKWQETNQGKQPRTTLETFKYDGPVVKFNDIEILEKIGHGGFGDVHFGKYKGTVVAVKKLRVQRVSQRRLRQFQEEVEILCHLDHPHIVKFLGACVVTPNLAILLEYMQKSLYDALHVEEQDYSSRDQYRILLHVADGLAYLHGMKVAHCDMKSTNILLDSSYDGVIAKISDFGLSLMKSETETSQSTAKVQGVGTPKYSAPEVLNGEELAQPAMCKADVYSMSVVAWEVLCQEVPFSGLNIHQLTRCICRGDVNLKFPEDVKVGDGLVALLEECWSHDANKRPSAEAFKQHLAKLQGIMRLCTSEANGRLDQAKRRIMPRGGTYADNAYNRSLGRVGAPMGSMPVSRSSSGSSGGFSHSSSGSQRTYVDNYYNRSIGRVGAPMGSMPMSRSSSGSSGGFSHSSSGSQHTYVDNSYNRSLGRVGAPMGSMPMSRSSSGSSGGFSHSSSGSQRTYVDNSYNRSLGRVGAPMGSMPMSRPSSASSGSSSKTPSDSKAIYVDNTYNRKLGRVGLLKGSMPVSQPSSASSGSSSKTPSDGQAVYVDNTSNRKLGRVGMPKGSMPVSQPSSASSGSSSTTPSDSQAVYVDNEYNRKLGRVGLPKGSKPVSKSSQHSGKVYKSTPLNQRLGRVGMPLGTMPYSRKKQAPQPKKTLVVKKKKPKPTDVMGKIMDHLLGPEEEDFVDFPSDIPKDEQDYMCETVLSLIRRMEQVLQWQETNQGKQPRTALETFKYDGPVIKFDEIEVLEKIGHGGFGDVHFGKYKGTVVAVKKLRVQRVSQRRLRQFREEVEILCRLDHPHIVKFLGACVVTPNLAILLEYMQKSLYDALHVKEEEYSPQDQYRILLHMADGLAYLHGMKVAHCDMKSTNILLDNSDEGVIAKISDFGLSLMKSETETSQSTAKVQGVGTPKYSAPEVLNGEELAQPAMCKADVYSMAVVAWEVLCQEVPFSGLNIHQLTRRICRGDVNLKFPEDVKVGDGLVALLKKCWSHDANKRPSAEAFKECLEKLEGIM
ncbi:uncharacterized protein LOC110986652 [Acanthaster planci]|uniref:Uncharacterized protein LOC110986652 n=1 Tax=Acanthaster planci TaxID=133434 RepID=A0A8B7ZHN9_ACAPL|nr:uncharacterized protein LOC110986652 [Acanthaster planci]